MQYEHCQLKFVKDISGFHSTHAIYIQMRIGNIFLYFAWAYICYFCTLTFLYCCVSSVASVTKWKLSELPK